MTPTSTQACNADPQATLALNESALSHRAEAVTPLGQPVRRNADVAGDGLQALSADEPLDGGRLLLRRKPALAPAFGGSGPARKVFWSC